MSVRKTASGYQLKLTTQSQRSGAAIMAGNVYSVDRDAFAVFETLANGGYITEADIMKLKPTPVYNGSSRWSFQSKPRPWMPTWFKDLIENDEFKRHLPMSHHQPEVFAQFQALVAANPSSPEWLQKMAKTTVSNFVTSMTDIMQCLNIVLYTHLSPIRGMNSAATNPNIAGGASKVAIMIPVVFAVGLGATWLIAKNSGRRSPY